MKNKRLIALTLSAVMFVSMLTSCINAKKSDKVVKEDDPWFESTRFDIDSEIPSGALTDYSQISVSNDKIYYTYLYTTDMFGSTHTCLDTYDLNGTKMVVSKGLGSHTLPLRIFNPCELCIIGIKKV